MIALLWILGVYVAILLLVVRFSLQPLRIPPFISPGALGLPQERVEFESTDGILIRGWWVDHAEPIGTAVFVHGYMMNRCEWVSVALRMHQLGYRCLLLDLRAHGRSQGKKCTLGWEERHDVAAASRWARARGGPLVLVGSSMGAAAIAFALAEVGDLAEAVILDSSYSQLSGAVLGWWNFLGGRWLRLVLTPTLWLTRLFLGVSPHQVDVAAAVAKITIPKLFIHGESDTLAEPSQALRNFEAAAEPKRIHWYPNRNHSEFRWEDPEIYLERVEEWLRSI